MIICFNNYHHKLTLIECDVEQKIRGAFMAFANRLACVVISSCSCFGNDANVSYFVPTKNGMAVYIINIPSFTLLNPLACRYHSLMEFKVLFRDKSNMNSIATASLQTKGSILTNSRCPVKINLRTRYLPSPKWKT